MRPCLTNEFRGFLSSSYKCGTCEKFFCADCHEEKEQRIDESHVCNEEAKASISAIKLDSKPCPGKNCGALIYKIDGCDHMWCVKCHTSFSWKTLQIIKSTNNPEYFRWMRENGQTPARVDDGNGCDVFPDRSGILVREMMAKGIHYTLFENELMHLFHIMEVSLPQLPTSSIDSLDGSELRVKYLMSEISKDEWKKAFMKLSKKHEINFERYQVLNMFCTCVKDVFMNFRIDKDANALQKQYDKLAEYANRQLRRINERYGSSAFQFNVRRFIAREGPPKTDVVINQEAQV